MACVVNCSCSLAKKCTAFVLVYVRQKRGTDLYDVPLADLVEGLEIHTLGLDTLVLYGGRDG